MSSDSSRRPALWVVIPAAGSGRRMASAVPKQYLTVAGRPVLQHTLERFLAYPRINGVVVVLTDGDPYWDDLQLTHPSLHRASGGSERCHSVLNGLDQLASIAAEDDWVLVHDAARPCLRRSDLDRLIDTVSNHPGGGLLGLPLTDTVKRAGVTNEVEATVDRTGLWRALTPQMFPLGPLRAALAAAIAADLLVTDEAAAMERAGYRPLMVEGHSDNIKITHPGDLALAELFLQQQERV